MFWGGLGGIAFLGREWHYGAASRVDILEVFKDRVVVENLLLILSCHLHFLLSLFVVFYLDGIVSLFIVVKLWIGIF